MATVLQKYLCLWYILGKYKKWHPGYNYKFLDDSNADTENFLLSKDDQMVHVGMKLNG